MKELIKQRLTEEFINKSEAKEVTKAYINSNEFNDKIERIVKDMLKKDKDMEKWAVEISRNVLIQLYKTLWVKRGFWQNQLSNKST